MEKIYILLYITKYNYLGEKELSQCKFESNRCILPLIVEIVFSFRWFIQLFIFMEILSFDCRTGTSKQKQSKPSSLVLGGLEFVIFCSTPFFIVHRSGGQNFGEKNLCSRVMKMLFSTKNSDKGQLKSQRICFDSSIAQERSQISSKLKIDMQKQWDDFKL